MSELHFQPIKGKAREILKAILQTPEVSSCSLKDGFVLRLACEEIVMNVTSYAYPDDVEGFMDIEIEKTDHRIVMRFKDGGTPFNEGFPDSFKFVVADGQLYQQFGNSVTVNVIEAIAKEIKKVLHGVDKG